MNIIIDQGQKAPVLQDLLSFSRLDMKYMYVCHAEMNAIMNKNSASVEGCTMYVALFPCNECAKMIIQVGKDDELSGKDVPFTVLSGDGGFQQLKERSRALSGRKIHILDPHQDAVYAELVRICETSKVSVKQL